LTNAEQLSYTQVLSHRVTFRRNNQTTAWKGHDPLLTISSVQRKSAASLIALLMAILCFSSLLSSLIEKTPLAYMDQRATTYVETTMARAAYTFAIVRGLNGMISVIQGTEIAVSPAGIGLNLSVGEVLDPINDLAERFSWIMLASTASLGVQRILMEMGDWLGLRVLLTMAMVLLAITPWKRFWVGWDLQSSATRLVLVALAVRLFIPALAVMSEAVYDRFLDRHYQEATQTVTAMSHELENVVPAVPQKDQMQSESTLQTFRQWMAETRNLIDIRATLERLGDKIEHFTEDTIRLMVVFIFQTILIPLVLLWLFTRTAVMRITPAVTRPLPALSDHRRHPQ
jgi:hypothetical protein